METKSIERDIMEKLHEVIHRTAKRPNALILNEYTYKILKRELKVYDISDNHFEDIIQWQGMHIIRTVSEPYAADIEFSFGNIHLPS